MKFENKNASISVVIPAYNAERFLARALESVLNQTVAPQEIIVVDDGSTDNTGAIVKQYPDRVRYIRQDNAGVAAARNTGIRHSQGEWIAFLDADDEWLGEKLQLQYHTLSAHPDISWASGAYIRVRQGKILTQKETFSPDWFDEEHIVKDALVPLAYRRHFWTGTLIVKRNVIRELGGFEESLITGEDIDLCFRLAVKCPKIVYITQCLAKYSADSNSSLTALAPTLNDVESVCRLARRVLARENEVESMRRTYIKRFAQQLIIVRVHMLLVRGKPKLARKVLRSLDWIDLGLPGWWLTFKAYIPFNIYKHIRRLFSFLKHNIVRKMLPSYR